MFFCTKFFVFDVVPCERVLLPVLGFIGYFVVSEKRILFLF